MIYHSSIIWLVLCFSFFLLEILTVSLVSIWFCVGAAVALVLSFIGTPVWMQGISFLLVSILFLFIIYPLIKKHIKTTDTNIDFIIGKSCVVTKDIDNIHSSGAVYFNGVSWSARSYDGSIIKKGDVVIIKKIEGVKLIVKKSNEKMKGEIKYVI